MKCSQLLIQTSNNTGGNIGHDIGRPGLPSNQRHLAENVPASKPADATPALWPVVDNHCRRPGLNYKHARTGISLSADMRPGVEMKRMHVTEYVAQRCLI
jgi:hypothetical protein